MTEGLRERKKRLMRAHLSDTAARMFLERGFDGLRVAEVAQVCGVSEKTVFNYFPTKEALLLDRLAGTMDALRTGLADPAVPPPEAAVRILDAELDQITAGAGDDPSAWAASYHRFGTLIGEAPSLRAYRSDMMDRFVTVAAEVLAARAGRAPDDPEPQIAASALLGLWRVQFQSLRRALEAGLPPAAAVPVERIRARVRADVRRAAAVISAGLGAGPVGDADHR